MLRQSKKTDKELLQKYMDICGADRESYKLHDPRFNNFTYQRHSVEWRPEQMILIDEINNFNGMCYILVRFSGNERVEDHALMDNLYIHWDDSVKAKRIKRIKKVRSRMIT